MSNDFNPGDVGINENGETVFCIEPIAGVRNSVDVLGRRAPLGRRDHVRRLVVLDPVDAPYPGTSTSPEDRIHRFLTDLSRNWGKAPVEFKMHGGTALIDWLASHFDPAPVRPPEPTGLGAVIEAVCGCNDEDPGRYVYEPQSARYEGRPHGQEHPWKSKCGHHTYDRLTAVTVLSEGVPS